jgi:hypothetical protein
MIKQLAPLTQYERDEKDLEPHALLNSGDPIEEAPLGAVITKIGLCLPEKLDLAGWETIGRHCARTDTAIQWAMGDWWAYGFHKWKRKAIASARKLPYEFGTLMNLGSVARKIKTSSRNEALSFSHHVVIAHADLDDDRQVKWLAKAQRFGWSVKQLRQKLDEHRSVSVDPDDPEHQAKHARDWACRFEQEAQKPTDRLFYSDHWLPFLSSATVRSLAELAAKSAKAWGDIADRIEQASQQRNNDSAESPRRKRLH